MFKYSFDIVTTLNHTQVIEYQFVSSWLQLNAGCNAYNMPQNAQLFEKIKLF
jgi:hypothetical protein